MAVGDGHTLGPFAELSDAARDRGRRETLAGLSTGDPLWVFGYGSLLWRPPFEPQARLPASVSGYRRRFRIWTVKARGTPACPGLGLGLEPGDGGCDGVALRLSSRGRDAALEALWEREMLTGIYAPRWLEIATAEGSLIALAFVVDPAHPQYAGPLPIEQQAERIATAAGELGPCREYLASTVATLASLGIREPYLERLTSLVQAYCDV